MDIQEQPTPEMTIDTVDTFDRPTGTIVRREVLEAGDNFRVAHLFLFNSKGDLLVQQLARGRERHPLAWGSSVASYLFAGETYDAAVRRRSLQELGQTIESIELIGHTRMLDLASEKFISLFRAVHDGPFYVDKSHIETVEFLPPVEIRRLMERNERIFTPTFHHLFSFYLRQTAAEWMNQA